MPDLWVGLFHGPGRRGRGRQRPGELAARPESEHCVQAPREGIPMTSVRLTAAAAGLLVLFASQAGSQQPAHPHGASPEALGTVHFQTSCSPAVTAKFDRGVALLHSFEFGGSIRAFDEVIAADS